MYEKETDGGDNERSETREGRKGKHRPCVAFFKAAIGESTRIQDFPREFGPLAAERAARFYSCVVELVDTIAVLFLFFFSGFSLCHSVHSDISFILYRVVRRVYESNIRQSDTRNERGKPRKSNGRSTCFATRNAGSVEIGLSGKF